MPSNLKLALDRIVTMQQESVAATYPNIDSFPYLRQQERTPYWTNNVTAFTIDRGSIPDEWMELRIYTVDMVLVLGNREENYDGATEETRHNVIEDVLNYFASRPYLTNSTDTTAFAYGDDFQSAAVITGGAMGVTEQGGTYGRRDIARFTLSLPIFYEIT